MTAPEQARSLEQRFAEAMGQMLGPNFPSDIGLAVSGGGDSMAMLVLAHNWARVWGLRLWVATVDHQLREGSAAEAAMVADECATLGWPHATLPWHWDGQGNLQEAARHGRLQLLDKWRGRLRHVLMAHTRDDLAETFVMRLARGSGVDGLSAMTATRAVRLRGTQVLRDTDYTGVAPPPFEPGLGGPVRHGTMTLLRPCLDMRRDDLRHLLRTYKTPWAEDPSNDDPRFDRVRVRHAGEALAALGLDVDTLAETAQRMARARQALRLRAREVWQGIGPQGGAEHLRQMQTGDIIFDRDGFEAVDRDTQLRLLSSALQYVATREHRPRAAALEALLNRVLSGGGGTLHGCETRCERTHIRVFREFAAVRELSKPADDWALWDGRWWMRSTEPGVEVRALGEEGWRQVKDKPVGAPPFHAARSLPALWQGDTLLACTAMGLGKPHTTKLLPFGRDLFDFSAFLLSH